MRSAMCVASQLPGASCSKHRWPNEVVKTSTPVKYMWTTLSNMLLFFVGKM